MTRVVLALGQDVDRIAARRPCPGIAVDRRRGAGRRQLRDGPSRRVRRRRRDRPTRSVDRGDRARPRRRSVASTPGCAPRRSATAAATGEPIAVRAAQHRGTTRDAPHAVRPRLDAARRIDDFEEVVDGLDADTALYEARRCLSCGNCFGCDNCFGVCPDNADPQDRAERRRPGYAIDYDYCKGCGLCVSECPCGAIEVQPELS